MADNLRKFSPDKHIDPARNFLTLPRLRVAAVMGFILGLVQMGVWSFVATAPGIKVALREILQVTFAGCRSDFLLQTRFKDP